MFRYFVWCLLTIFRAVYRVSAREFTREFPDHVFFFLSCIRLALTKSKGEYFPCGSSFNIVLLKYVS